MLMHYFRLDNLKAHAAAIKSGQHGWMIGHRFADSATATLWPQLLDLVDSINSASDRQTKELYAETAARVLSISMVGAGMIAVEDQQEELVNQAQTAHQATDSIIRRVTGMK